MARTRPYWPALALVLLLALGATRWWRSEVSPPGLASSPPAAANPSSPPAVEKPAPLPAETASAAPPSEPLVLAAPTPRPPPPGGFSTMEEWRRARSERPASMPPAEPPLAQRTPLAELRATGLAVRNFRAALGANPVGANAEIVRALLGANPNGARFLDPAAVNLNAEGEMLDAWGRPVFFHQISSTLMEIRSAGPDGRMFTADDVVTP